MPLRADFPGQNPTHCAMGLPRDFLVVPNVVRQASRHRRGNPQGLVDAGEVVMDEV